MDKPISLVINEAKEVIVGAVNSINLPAVLLEPIIKELYDQICQLKEFQYQSDKAEYERSLQEEQIIKEQDKQELESTE